MDPVTTEVLKAAVAAAVGAVVKTFAPDIKVLLTGRARINYGLIGEWKCKWVGESGNEFDDMVKISRVWGEKLYARGINTQYGNYKITGRLSLSNLATFHYEGVRERQPLGGVVIMKLNPTRNELKGFWYEYGREEKIVGGSAEWKKAP